MSKLLNVYDKFQNLESIVRFKNYITKFFDSDIYILLILATSLLNWKMKEMWPILIIGSLLYLLIIIFDINRIRLVPLTLLGIISLRLDDVKGFVTPAIIASIIVVPLLVIDLFRKKVNFNNNIFIGMVLLLISMIFSIVNAPNLTIPTLGILMWVFYTFVFLYIYNKKNDHDSIENNRIYVAKSMTYLGIGIFLEIVLFFLDFIKNNSPSQFFNGKYVELGWAMTNYVAMLLLMIIPLTSYLFVKKQKYYLLFIILIEIGTLILMLSRGAYLAILITTIPFLIRFIADVKDKTKFTKAILIITIAFLLTALLFLIPTGIVKNFFEVLNDRGISLTGRELIYKIGLKTFKQYPLFGGGVYTSEYYISLVANSVYYHNYVVHTLATIGIIGMIAFLFYIYHLIKQSAINVDYNIYVFFIVLNMLIHGLFDTTFYNPLVMVVFSLILPLLTDKRRLEPKT